MKIKTLLLVIVVLMLFASCTSFQLSGFQVTEEIPSYQTVGQFEINVPIWEFLGASGGTNLLNATSATMDTAIYDAIQREISKFTADAAVNVVVVYKATAVNLFINGVTGGLLAPATAHISGTLVKYNN